MQAQHTETWTHVQIIAGITLPLGTALVVLLVKVGSMKQKLDTMYVWFEENVIGGKK